MRPALLALILFLAGGCGRAPAPGTGERGLPPRVLVVVVTGLSRGDPLLDELPGGLRASTDLMATGRGSTAVLELLDGRPAVDQLRTPRDPLGWARRAGIATEVVVLDPGLRSEPEWVHSGVGYTTAGRLEPPAAGLKVVVVPRDGLAPADLSGLPLDDLLLVVAGIPAAPDRDRRPGTAESASALRDALRAEVRAGGRGVERLALSGRRVLGEVLAPVRGSGPTRQQRRVAHWWNELGGGVLVDDGETVAVAGSGRAPVAAGIGPTPEAEELLAGMIPEGDLLVLLRGSDGADLAMLELTTGRTTAWRGWGLEPIDSVQELSARTLALDLAIEPEGDGLIVEDWTGQRVDVHLRHVLEDAPVIGAPVRDAGDSRWLGVNALRIQPWSRVFWKLTRPVDFDPERWWRSRSAGIDLLWLPRGEVVPAPVSPGR